MAKEIEEVKNEIIFEFRYKANPRVLDHRGEWAKAISDQLKLEHWKILDSRIDIFEEGEVKHAFIGHKNGGITIINVPNKEFFPNYVTNMIKFIFQLKEFGDPIHIERIGVRQKFCEPFSGSYEELINRFTRNYVNITDKALGAIGPKAKLIDVGGPLNFVDDIGNFNTMCGPMEKTQFPNFFTRNEGFPKIGLYYDIDYWVRPNKDLKSKQVIDKVQEFSNAGWESYVRVRDLLLRN